MFEGIMLFIIAFLLFGICGQLGRIHDALTQVPEKPAERTPSPPPWATH